jgi:hypothetical protein
MSESIASIQLNDLEWFIKLGGLVGFKQFGFADIRARQDAELTEALRQRALARIDDQELIQVTDDSYFLGSVDYMVRETPQGQIGYTVLETNGGSSRGLTILAPPDVERLMGAFVEMLRYIDQDESPLILVGYPDGDALITEKFLTMYRLKEALERERPGLTVRIVTINDFRTMPRVAQGEAIIVLSPHSQSSLSLRLQGEQVYLLDKRVHMIIGDGVVARHHQLGGGRSDVVLANWTFPITGDKFSTYDAIDKSKDLLTPHGLYPLQFWRAWSEDELMTICEEKRHEVDGLVIKPFQGSGGAGVIPVLSTSSVSQAVADSLGEFRSKYGQRISPFPYTVCEKINPRKATWRENPHNYDIRIYVARSGDQLMPIGCLFRIAPLPDKGTYSKGSLIVNLSGYGGIAIERGLGLTEESLQSVHLEEADIVRIFTASTILMAEISRHPIDWGNVI